MVRLAGSLAAVACWWGLAAAQPANRQEAAEHFKLAKAAEKDGRHQEAIDEYLLAYTLVPHADVLYNIAVNYEALQQWARAVEYYERYLDERTDRPSDADAVIAKIKELKAKSPPPAPTPRAERPAPPVPTRPQTAAADAPPPGGSLPGTGTGDVTPPLPGRPLVRWHGGLSYGVGFGDAPVDRYMAHSGVRLAELVDLDAVIGGFGKNDHGLGVLTRIVVAKSALAQPFLRGALTVSYAKQDASSSAGTRFPLGVEAGAGLQLGARGRVELDVVGRWTFGGWDAASTMVDSYVADAFELAIDVGFVADFGLTSGAR